MDLPSATVSLDKTAWVSNYFEKFFLPVREDRIGVEFEFPILSLNGKLWSLGIIDQLNKFIQVQLGFRVTVLRGGIALAFQHPQLDDKISYEVTHSTLEFSLAPQDNIVFLEQRFFGYFIPLQEFLLGRGVFLGCTGIHPLPYHRNFDALPHPHYKNIEAYLKVSAKGVHPDYRKPHLLMIGNQTHIQVPFHKLYQYLNMYHAVGWIECLLFANSFKHSAGQYLCCYRDFLLRHCGFAANPKNVEYPDLWYQSNNDFFDDFLQKSIFTKKEKEKYAYFSPIQLNRLEVPRQRFASGNQYVDLSLLDLEDCLTFNPIKVTTYGTLEMRGCCQQPLADIFAPAAFHLALREAHHIILEMLPKAWSEYAELLRWKANHRHVAVVQQKETVATILGVLFSCLQKRNYGEEKYLSILFDRVSQNTNPALVMNNQLEKGKSITSHILKDSLPYD
jgi:gamma-glutamylcysteine synthetase